MKYAIVCRNMCHMFENLLMTQPQLHVTFMNIPRALRSLKVITTIPCHNVFQDVSALNIRRLKPRYINKFLIK